ncbi:DUF6093 family protein [Streptomyces sp. NPDC056485]|uniref:DUF6093 family protein n=1 Tax=Streptomyces sp. NPDC056485 TaxID=3345834 RepID=UPI0036C775EE
MSITSAATAGRRAAEARMRDTVRLYRQAADIFDRVSGETVPGPQSTLYTGRARVKAAPAVPEDTEAGEREVTRRRYGVDLPWATRLPGGGRILPGDRIEVTATADARMLGLALWVLDAEYGDQTTAWRISTEDRA